MNKSILLSIRPEWVSKILTHKKTIEVRKQFPKDYKGWVYIYCTKSANKKYEYLYRGNKVDGKVVARFWCDKVGEIKRHNAYSLCTIGYHTFVDRFYSDADLQKASCLNGNELMWYLKGEEDNEIVGYAIYISKLEIFDKPRELREFYTAKPNDINEYFTDEKKVNGKWVRPIKKTPQNYYYIEGEE